MNRTEEREALYTAYSEKVRGYVFGKVANRHDAEDLVSDVFLKAYEKYPTFDADRASTSIRPSTVESASFTLSRRC